MSLIEIIRKVQACSLANFGLTCKMITKVVRHLVGVSLCDVHAESPLSSVYENQGQPFFSNQALTIIKVYSAFIDETM